MMLRFFVVFTLVAALFLHSLPMLVRDQAVIWLLNNGADRAGFSALEINWLKGIVRVKGLYAEGKGKPRLQIDLAEVDLDYGLLTDSKVLISDLRLDGIDVGVTQRGEQLWLGTVDLNQFNTGEQQKSEAPDGASAWSFGLANMALSDTHWRTDLPGQKHHLSLLTAKVEDLYLWDQAQPVSVDLEGALNGAPIRIESSSTPLPEEKKSSLNIKLTQFPVHSVTAAFIPSLRAHVDLDLKIDADTNLNTQVLNLQQEGSIRVRDFLLKQDGANIQHNLLDWQGKLKLALKGEDLKAVSMNSTLALKGFDLLAQGQAIALSDMQLTSSLEMEGLKKLRVEGLQFVGNGLKLNTGIQQLAIQNADFHGNVKSNDLSEWQASLPLLKISGARLNAKNDQLMTLESLKLEEFVLQEVGQIDLKAVSLSALKVMGDGGVFSQWGGIKGEGLHLNQLNQLAIDRLTLNNSSSRVLLSNQRKLTDLEWLLARLESTSGPQEPSSKAKANSSSAASEPFRVSVGDIILQGDNPISIVDQGVQPHFKTDLNISELQLTSLDTGSKGETTFRLKAKNGFSTISAKGGLELFSGNFGGHWEAEVKGLGLPQVSPYSLEYTGYYMHSGQLSLDTSGSIKGRKLNGDMDIRLNKLEVEAQNSGRSGEFDQKVSMPLSTAIMILKDNDDNIDLQIPIDGSLDDPQFGYQTVINKLAGKGLKSAAMGYLTKALQPFGALISIGQMVMDAQDKGGFITLQPVYFSPAASSLNKESKAYLGKLSQMMKDRKGMRMNICGSAVAVDQPAIWESLLTENKKRKKPLAEETLKLEQRARLQSLAENRSDAVKGAMVKQGIDIERLFSCYPKVDLKSQEKPQVALGL